MNLNKEFSNKLTGEKYTKSLPKDEEEKKLPETLKNVLLNVLSLAKIRDRKEAFYINHIAEAIIKADNGELTLREPYLKFLVDSCYDAIFGEDPKTGNDKGFMMAGLMSQVLEELGEKSSITN